MSGTIVSPCWDSMQWYTYVVSGLCSGTVTLLRYDKALLGQGVGMVVYYLSPPQAITCPHGVYSLYINSHLMEYHHHVLLN